jgi:choline-sulfatase
MGIIRRDLRHGTRFRMSAYCGIMAWVTLLLGSNGGLAVEGQRPNFLFILADDQAPHSIGAYGNDVCQTPHLDRLAREGMLIHDAHHMGSWSGAVCRPSRTMIMTGRSVWRIPGVQNRTPTGRLDEAGQQQLTEFVAQRSMPALFNAAGYDTMRTCKLGNTFPPASRLFQVLHEKDMREGNDEEGSAWHAERVLDFLKERENNSNRNPFLIFLGFSHPHDPRNGKPELLEKYGAENRQRPPTQINPLAPPLPINYLPEHPFPHGHPNLRDEMQVEGVLSDRSEATIRNELGREYACIDNLDQQVGRVLEKLEAMGELDNTYIFYTADHGIAVGRHGLMGKQNLYEHTWRVPLIVRGPGIKAGSHASGFVYLMDLLPTLCDLAGIQPADGMEGLSFRRVLEGQQERVRDVLYGVYCGGTKPGMRSVKTADGWKLIKVDVLDGSVRETQLFNLRENPDEFLVEHQAPHVVERTANQPTGEQINLANDPRYASQRAELEALLLNEQIRLDDPYRLWDQPSN